MSADLAHLVERHLAKVEVAGSSPVIRSKQSTSLIRGAFCFCLRLEQVRDPFESHSRESSTSQVYVSPRSLLCLTPFVKTTFSCFRFTNP